MDRKGLTLLEILVSAIIMALVMTGLASVFIAAKRHIQRPRAAMAGGELERYLFSDRQMEVRQDQWGNSTNCLSSSPTSGCPSNMTISGVTYNLTWSISGVAGTNLRRARITLTWPRPQ